MASCTECGREIPEENRFCAECARRSSVLTRPQTALLEASYITDLLQESVIWRAHGWICDHCYNLLTQEHVRQLTALLRDIEADAEATKGSARAATEISAPADAVAVGSAGTGSRPEPELGGPALAEFMEAHSMKLLALLAALFIFVGMRQILVWEWASGLALALIPLLPISLTTILYYFGMRSRGEKTFGGYAYCVVAIVLTAFTVFSINAHWFGGALARPYTLLLGVGASTCLTAWTLRKTGDIAFLHLLLGGIAATLIAGLQIARPSAWLAPEPMWLYGSTLLALAFLYLYVARRMREAAEEESLARKAVGPLLFWMHLCAGAVLTRELLLYAVGVGSAMEAGSLFGLASLLYGLFAQWFAGARVVYAASGAASLSAVLLLAGTGRFEWYSVGFMALLLGSAALGMARWNRLRSEPSLPSAAGERAAAFMRIAWIMSGAAGGALLGRLLWAFARLSSPSASADWAAGVLLAGLCCALYTGMACWLRNANILYAAMGAAAFAMTVVTNRLLPDTGLFAPHTLAHDLFPFAAASLVVGLWANRRLDAHRTARIENGAFPLLLSSLVAVGTGVLIVVWQGLVDATSAGLWSVLVPYSLLSAAGTAAIRVQEWRTLRSLWASCLMAYSAACAGFLASAHAPAAPWTPALAAGMALTLLAWAWYALAEWILLPSIAPANCLRAGAGVMAVFGSALATSGADGAAGWMTLIFAGALALLVTMGMRGKSVTPVLVSFAIVILCPLRLADAAFDPHETATPAAFAAVLFALFAAVVYGLVTWRMRKPDLIWLAAASLGIAGGGGFLFGAPQPPLARSIAAITGVGMALGALGLGSTAAWGRRQALTDVAGILMVVAYWRLVSIFFAIERPWMGLVLLPALTVLVAASHIHVEGYEIAFHQPLQRVALAIAYVALPWLAIAAFAAGSPAYYPLAVTLFSYALVFGISAHAGAELDHPLGILSTAALVGGWVFGLHVPRSDPYAWTADVLLVVVTGVCAVLYGRVAWRLQRRPPAYGAALAGCFSWIGLFARAAHLPDAFWSLALLPFLLGLYVVGEALQKFQQDSLGAPLRHIATGAAGPAVVWVVMSGLERGLAASVWVVTGTLAMYGAAFVAATLRYRTAFWAAWGASIFTLALGYYLAASAGAASEWAWRFALAALFWFLAARLLERKENLRALAAPLYLLSMLVAGVAGVVALVFIGSPDRLYDNLAAFVIVGSVETALFLAGRGAWHAHGGFAGYLPAYFLLMRHVGRLDSTFTDLYLLPVGLYVLWLAHLAVRRGRDVGAWALRWCGLLTLLAPTFSAFYLSYTQGGTPVHALLLLLECVAAVSYGIARRIRAFVQAGTLFALGFVVVGSFTVEIWTGLFSVVLGLALLAGVFYISVHQKALRSWISRVGDRWHQWR